MRFTFLSILLLCLWNYVNGQIETAQQDILNAYRDGDYTLVVENLSRLESYDSLDWQSFYYIGASYFNLFQVDHASHFLFKADSLNPEDLQILKTIAGVYKTKGNNTKAIAYYEKCLALDSSNVYPRIQIANIRYEEGNYTDALNNYLILHQYDPTNYYFNKQLGKCYRKLDNKDMAMQHFTKAIEQNPEDINTTYILASLLIEEEQYDSAEILVDNILELDSSNTRIIKQKGYIKFLENSFDESVKWFKKALEYNDTSELTYKILGMSYYRNAYYDSAIASLSKAYQLDTNDVEVVYFIGVSYGLLLEEEKGLEYLNKAMELIIPSKDIMVNIYGKTGELYNAIGEYNKALLQYLTPHYFYPNEPVLLFYIAIQYDYMTKYDKALKYYERFLSNTNTEFETELPDGMTVSYNEYARKRVKAINEELFFRGKIE